MSTIYLLGCQLAAVICQVAALLLTDNVHTRGVILQHRQALLPDQGHYPNYSSIIPLCV
jgi:hypothetical protein